MVGESKIDMIEQDTNKIRVEDNGKGNSPNGKSSYLDMTTKDLVEYVKAKGFHDEVLNALTEARISGLNIPELVNKEFLKSIGIERIGDLGGLQKLFQLIICPGNE
jgi:hypothetical protein